MPLVVPAKKNGRASAAATERGGGGGGSGGRIVAGDKERPSLRGVAVTAEESAAKARHAASSRSVEHDAQNAVRHSLDAGQGAASTSSGSMFVKTVNIGSTGITGRLIFSAGLAPTDPLSVTSNAGTTAKTPGALRNALPPYTHTPRQPGDNTVRESVYIHRAGDSGVKNDARKPIRHSSVDAHVAEQERDKYQQWTGYRHVGRRVEVSARPFNEGKQTGHLIDRIFVPKSFSKTVPTLSFCSPEYAARNTGCTSGFIVVKTVNAGASGISGGLVFSTGTIAQKAKVKEVKEKAKNAQLEFTSKAKLYFDKRAALLGTLAAAQTDAEAARAEAEETKAKVKASANAAAASAATIKADAAGGDSGTKKEKRGEIAE